MGKVAIKDVVVNDRIRQDFGDITELANDIRSNGLLQPIVISPNGVLLCGERRLKACEKLGMNEIEAVVRTPEDEHQALLMEIAENEKRKPFNVSEMLAYASKLHPIVSEEAKSNMCGSVEGRKHSKKINTNEVLAKESGFGSRENYRKARFVAENDIDGQMMKELDDGSTSIDAAYKKLKQQLAEQEKTIAEQKAMIDERDATIQSYEEAEDEQSDAYEKLANQLIDVKQKLKAAEAARDFHDRDAVVQNTIDDLTSERDEALKQRDEALDQLAKRYRPSAQMDKATTLYLAIGKMIADCNASVRTKISEVLDRAYQEISALA